jgi:hypothetical protein
MPPGVSPIDATIANNPPQTLSEVIEAGKHHRKALAALSDLLPLSADLLKGLGGHQENMGREAYWLGLAMHAGQIALESQRAGGDTPDLGIMEWIWGAQEKMEGLPAGHDRRQTEIAEVLASLVEAGASTKARLQQEALFSDEVTARRTQLARQELVRRHPVALIRAALSGAGVRRPLMSSVSAGQIGRLAHARAQRIVTR